MIVALIFLGLAVMKVTELVVDSVPWVLSLMFRQGMIVCFSFIGSAWWFWGASNKTVTISTFAVAGMASLTHDLKSWASVASDHRKQEVQIRAVGLGRTTRPSSRF